MPAPTATQATTNTTPQSCLPASVDVRSCLRFDALWNAHPLNWVGSKERVPFRNADGTAAYEDQCAIKMSLALQGGGLAMSTFRGATETRPVKQLNKSVRAALRAEELAEWLVAALGKPAQYKDGIAALSEARNRKGIVFFKDFWCRQIGSGQSAGQESFDNRSGDHIDLWNGTSVPDSEPVRFDDRFPLRWWNQYFGNAKAVWFWELNR